MQTDDKMKMLLISMYICLCPSKLKRKVHLMRHTLQCSSESKSVHIALLPEMSSIKLGSRLPSCAYNKKKTAFLTGDWFEEFYECKELQSELLMKTCLPVMPSMIKSTARHFGSHWDWKHCADLYATLQYVHSPIHCLIQGWHAQFFRRFSIISSL